MTTLYMPQTPLKEPLLWGLNDYNEVRSESSVKNLEASLEFILNHTNWVHDHLQEASAQNFCYRLFRTIPPSSVKSVMDVAKEIIIQTTGALELLLAMHGDAIALIEKDNPFTNGKQTFIQINLANLLGISTELLASAFTAHPEYGISVIGEQKFERLEGLSRAVPQMKAFRCPGVDLDAIPSNWCDSIEWLFCTIMPNISISSCFSRLKGLSAPQARHINLEIDTLAFLDAPRALEIDCARSKCLEHLRAPMAKKVNLGSYNSLKDIDLSSEVVLHQPPHVQARAETTTPKPAQVPSIEEFSSTHLSNRFKIITRYNLFTKNDQSFLLLNPKDQMLSEDDFNCLQIAFSNYPEVGLIVPPRLYGVIELVELIPQLKTLWIHGTDLDALPEKWKNSVECLFCNAVTLAVPHFPNLKCLVAPDTIALQCEKPRLEMIVAPKLISIHLKQPLISPIIHSDQPYKLSSA